MQREENQKIVVGTRGSELALAQARAVVAHLEAAWPGRVFTIKTVTTTGDRFKEKDAAEIGTGIFTKEIERQLISRGIDIAVHSLKDLPTSLADGLTLAAATAREDPRDALISANGVKLAGLPEGARIGTGSVRRAAMLLAYRRDFEIVPIRGNVPTRIKKLETMKLAAVVLALAGLRRLGLEDAPTEIIEPDVMLPAAGQGIVALEARSDDTEVLEIAHAIEDPAARIEAQAERHLMALLGGGCRAPIGMLARAGQGKLSLTGAVLSPDGKRVVKAHGAGASDNWREVAGQVADKLHAGGAAQILTEIRSQQD